jgi:hypothetical protein
MFVFTDVNRIEGVIITCVYNSSLQMTTFVYSCNSFLVFITSIHMSLIYSYSITLFSIIGSDYMQNLGLRVELFIAI